MKKVLTGILSAAVLVSSLAGCSSVNKDKYINNNSQSSESQSSENTAQSSEAFSDWTTLTFGIGTESYTPEFNLSVLTDSGWSFDPALYGLNDLTVTPGLRLSCDVYLAHESCDDGVLAVGFTNTGDSDVALADCQIWSVRVDIKDKNNYPAFSVPGNVQWNTPQNDIKALLGEPSETKQEEEGCTELVYNKDGNKIIHYYVYDEGGFQKFWIEKF
ncbi:hypothetical protein [Porcipelethomonas sp.]|uniref:hypothetical protein n=1 Tax=Porcipelethomonas sp. TaxID=2981675 RepID=UPI003EF0D2A6